MTQGYRDINIYIYKLGIYFIYILRSIDAYIEAHFVEKMSTNVNSSGLVILLLILLGVSENSL